MNKQNPQTGNDRPGYEKSDIDVKPVLRAGGILLLTVVLALVAMGWMFDILNVQESRNEPAPSIFVGERTPPPEPRLQVYPTEDLRQIRQSERELLQGYGWVDRQQRIARIPVDLAFQWVVERGLPNWPARPENEALIQAGAPPNAKPGSPRQ